MRQNTRLRFKLYAMVLPLVIVVNFISGYQSFQQAYGALGRIANRHLAFKAEQLRDFAQSEWEVISRLGLDEKPEYRAAAEKSIRQYAGSLLRGDTELIAAFDQRGVLVMSVSRGAALDEGVFVEMKNAPLDDGWFSGSLLGEARVGVAFAFSPLGWKVAVTDLEPSFFSELDGARTGFIIINVVAAIALVVLLSVFLRYIVKPVERFSKAIREISAAKDLSRRVETESGDEMGALAIEFNAMISRLEGSYAALEKSNQSERAARWTVTQREKETIMILGRVSDFRDEETGQHLKRIGEFSALFFRLLGHDEETQDLLRDSAPLHDIGKIGTPDSILLKPGKLTSEEYEIIKRHTTLGYELLKGAQGIILAEASIIALTHHEKWDGSGYPRGLSGEAIPLCGRVVGILDVFDALISKRCYKDVWPLEQARDHIAGQSGKHFDPLLVDIFMGHFDEFKRLSEDIGLLAAT